MRVAALDLGTNSFLCLVAEVSSTGLRVIEDRATIVRLGQGVAQSGRFHPDALERAENCIEDFSKMIVTHGVTKVLAVATSAARDVSNGHELTEILQKRGLSLEIISGQREAELTFSGATADLSGQKNSQSGTVVVDVGGGSTEAMAMDRKRSLIGRSVDLGAVRCTEKWLGPSPVSAQELEELRKHIRQGVAELAQAVGGKEMDPVQKMVAVAGTPTTLAAMTCGEDFSIEHVEGFVLSRSVLQDWIRRLAEMSFEQRLQLPGLPKGRADIILAGALILDEAMNAFAVNELIVSTRGVRYGLVMGEMR